MENQDLDLIGQTAGNMPYKIGIVDEKGNLKNQFVAKASTNRIDIPQSSLGAGGVPQIPSTTNIFSGLPVGNISLSGVTPNFDNVQDGLLITLSNLTSGITDADGVQKRMDLSPSGLKPIKIPKEKLIINSSFDISDQLSQYIGKAVNVQWGSGGNSWGDYSDVVSSTIVSFGGATIKILPTTTLSMNLIVNTKSHNNTSHGDSQATFPVPVIQVNDYKN